MGMSGTLPPTVLHVHGVLIVASLTQDIWLLFGLLGVSDMAGKKKGVFPLSHD